MITEGHDQEVGRELKAEELRPKTVVVIKPPRRNVYLSMWVAAIDAETVLFHSGEMNWTVINFRQPDGSIVDDKGGIVRMFEYMGKV
jgi:hypothetical protein